MESAPHDVLLGFIRKYGTGLIRDPVRCEGLLRDTCGEYTKEVFVLISALRNQVPQDLLAGYGRTSPAILCQILARRLEERCAFEENAASWAVTGWAVALGLADAGNLPEAEAKAAGSQGNPAGKREIPGRDVQARVRADIAESAEILAGSDVPGKLAFLRSLRDRADPGETGILIHALENGNWEVRYTAFEALQERGENAGNQLVCALRERSPGDPDGAIWRIALLLGTSGNRDAVPVLRDLLENGNATQAERRAAIWALGETGDLHLGEILLSFLSETDDRIRKEAEEAVRKTGKKEISSGLSSG